MNTTHTPQQIQYTMSYHILCYHPPPLISFSNTNSVYPEKLSYFNKLSRTRRKELKNSCLSKSANFALLRKPLHPYCLNLKTPLKLNVSAFSISCLHSPPQSFGISSFLNKSHRILRQDRSVFNTSVALPFAMLL